MTAAVIVLGCILMLEICLRWYRFPLAPLRLRRWYASCLLPGQATKTLIELHRRTEQAGLRSFEELYSLYASASGKSPAEIKAAIGLEMPWRALASSQLALRYRLKWHVGLVPDPQQQSRTITITAEGTRSNGWPPLQNNQPCKRVVMTGDSVAFGLGATSDYATIGGRLEYHLNKQCESDRHRWKVENYAFPAATSFQELICVLQCLDPSAFPNYVVSLAGCNDVEQRFINSARNVSGVTQDYTDSLTRDAWSNVARTVGKRMFLLRTVKRFVKAYRQWPGTDCIGLASSGADGRA